MPAKWRIRTLYAVTAVVALLGLANCEDDQEPSPVTPPTPQVTIYTSLCGLYAEGYPVDTVVFKIGDLRRERTIHDEIDCIVDIEVDEFPDETVSVEIETFDHGYRNGHAEQAVTGNTTHTAYFVPVTLETTPPADPLLLSLPLNGNLLDQGQDGRHAEAVGPVTYVEDRFGNENAALRCEAVEYGDGGIRLIGSEPFPFAYRFTISLWFRHTDVNDYPKGLVDYAPESSLSNLAFEISESANYLSLRTSSQSINTRSFQPPLHETSWVHLVIAAADEYYPSSRRYFRVWANGEQILSNGFYFRDENPLDCDCRFQLARSFTGTIDDVRIYGGYLSQSEILNLYREAR